MSMFLKYVLSYPIVGNNYAYEIFVQLSQLSIVYTLTALKHIAILQKKAKFSILRATLHRACQRPRASCVFANKFASGICITGGGFKKKIRNKYIMCKEPNLAKELIYILTNRQIHFEKIIKNTYLLFYFFILIYLFKMYCN